MGHDEDLSNVYWIGGSFSGGKTTVARALASEYGLNLYAQDGHLLQDPAFSTYRMKDEKWFWLPNDQKADRYRRAFPLSFEQIVESSRAGPTLVEGPGLLPELLANVNVHPSRAIYLLPTPEFQRWANRHRSTTSRHGDWVGAALSSWPDPSDAWERWMTLDDLFADEIERSAESFGYRAVRVDRTSTPAELASAVAEHFCLLLHTQK